MCMYIYTYKNRMIRSLVNFESKNDHASNDDIEMTKSLLQQTWIHIRSKRLSPDRSSSISCIRISQIHRRERNKKPVSLYYWGNKGECYARWTILLIIDYKRQSCEETRENNTARFRSASSRTIFETRRRIFYEFYLLNDILFNFVDRPPPVHHSWSRDSFRRRSRIREKFQRTEERGAGEKRKKFVKILNLWPKLDRRLNDRNYRNYYFGLSVTCFRAILSRYCANRDESIVYYFSIGTKIGWIGYYRRCVRDRASFLARALRRELSSTLRGRKLWTSAVFFIPLADTSIPESRRTRSIFSWKCPVTRYAAKKRGKSGGEKEGTWKKKWKRKKREKNKSRIARTINEKSLYKRTRDV